MKYPTITIVTLSLNPDECLWKKSLKSITYQNYPKDHIEHLVMDGGSIPQKLTIAKEFGCNIVSMPKFRNLGEARKGYGIQMAKGDLVVFIETDNILPDPDWFIEMVRPFQKRNDICAAFSMYHSYEKDMPALTKYSALIGINDPTVYYLGKSEKLPRFETAYDKGTILEDNAAFTVVRFQKNNLPVLGDNGHMVRRNIINKVNSNPNRFVHTDAFMNLLSKGFDTYGVVKNSVIHYTGSSIYEFYRKRLMYKKTYGAESVGKRSYLVYNPKSADDVRRLLLFIVYSLTWIQPIYTSMKGYVKIHEPAWFLHPVMCFLATMSYGISEFSNLTERSMWPSEKKI